MRKKITGFSLDEDVIEGIKELAKKDGRTVSNYVNILLANYLKEGCQKPKTKKKEKLNRRK